jgi:hypothetical protein
MNNLKFELVKKGSLPLGNGQTLPHVRRYLVELGKPEGG